MNVRIDGNHEIGRRNCPETQIDTVGWTNHPTCVEDEPFARAACTRITDQVPQASACRITTKRVGETSQAFAEVSIARPVKADEGIAERSVRPTQFPGSP